ncbi:hypothetical protein QFZ77_001635 [Paenibacillus sp. V4I3]|nr:hypothetical protein [Paenibacillus sp. V4I3]
MNVAERHVQQTFTDETDVDARESFQFLAQLGEHRSALSGPLEKRARILHLGLCSEHATRRRRGFHAKPAAIEEHDGLTSLCQVIGDRGANNSASDDDHIVHMFHLSNLLSL